MHKLCLAIVLSAVLVGGCQDFKKEHPDFPKWGWWEKKQTPETQPTTTPADSKNADQPEATPIGPVDNSEENPADPTDSKTDMSAEDPRDTDGPVAVNPDTAKSAIPTPPDHRSKVWEHVKKLRDLSSYPEDKQKEMIAYAQENVQEWYNPMDVPSPDMNKSDWVIVMVWDFMPPAEFQQAAANWKQYAESEGMDFPKHITRRKLMNFVKEMQDRKP